MSHHHFTRPLVLAIALAALAAPASGASRDDAARALHLRSQALNDRYVRAATTDPAERALHLRSQALNDRYSPPAPVPAHNGIDWTDAGIGAAAMFLALGLVTMAGYRVMQRTRRLTS